MWTRIFIITAILLLDLFLYFFLGLMMMNYEDFYTPADGPWYSLQSMDTQEQLIWFSYISWFVLNGIAILLLLKKFVSRSFFKRPS